MVTVEELNDLRQRAQWKELKEKCQEHLKSQPNTTFALRALAQSLEKLEEKNNEYEGVLVRLLELKDRQTEIALKLGRYYRDINENEEAIRHLEIALQSAADERQYDELEEIWLELADLAPFNIPFFMQITQQLEGYKQYQRAATLLQMLLPICEDNQDWKNRLNILRQILKYTPKDESLREPIVDTLRKLHEDNLQIERVLDHSNIRSDRPLPEALEEVELLVRFLPDSYVRHPDWGIGRVKDLDMSANRVIINFQRKRNHKMDLQMASTAVESLARDDFRVLRIVDSERITNLIKEDPVELVKIMLRSFGGTITAKEIKEYMVPSCIAARNWTSWWSNTSSAIRRDSYIAVSGGSNKRYTLREQAASDEDELLKRFDETKAAHSKVDIIYDYLRTTKKNDIHAHVIRHFSKKLHAIAPRRPSHAERAELYFTNEDLKDYGEDVESISNEILDKTLENIEHALKHLEHLRFKSHQWRYAQRFKEIYPEKWPQHFKTLLLGPNIQIRDELAKTLEKEGHHDLLSDVVDITLSDFRKLPSTFIWLSSRSLSDSITWLDGKIQNAVIIDRLLLLVDFLTSQAKRREKDEAAWLRKVASDARDIIRKNRYSLFKEHIQEAGESLAQSIYRRAQTNEGIDKTTAMDLTTIVRARFPNLFQQATEEESAIPEGLLCLKASLERKQALLKRLIEQELPAVVQEIETARGHGDLKENAEYHAAKDKQKLLASQTGELQEQVQMARTVDLEQIATDRIGFGTRFRLSPTGSDRIEEYVMLGPWESDPDNGILSYQAPFARGFMGKTVGETVGIELPMHTGQYEIVSNEKISQEEINQIIERMDQQASNFRSEKAEEVEVNS